MVERVYGGDECVYHCVGEDSEGNQRGLGLRKGDCIAFGVWCR